MRNISNKWIDYLFLLLIIIISGYATAFYRSVTITLILFIITITRTIINGTKLNKNLFYAYSIWFGYISLSFLKYQGLNIYWPFSYFVNLTIAYGIIHYYGIELLRKSEKIIFYLVIWSCILFLAQIFSFNEMLEIWQKYDISGELFTKETTYYYHAFLYTIIQFVKDYGTLPRNAGFCWEPGPFSAMINIGIFMLLINNNFDIFRVYKKFIIYTLALISTQSTTGFLMYFILLSYSFYEIGVSKIMRYLLILLAVSISIIAFLNLDFLGEKLRKEFEADFMIAAINAQSSQDGSALSRIVSLRISFLDFLNNPILGYGANDSSSWLHKNNLNTVATITGLGNFLARFGIVLTIIFYYLLYKSSAVFANLFKYKSKWLFFIIMFIFSISFNIMEAPFYLSLVFFWLFYRRNGLSRFSKYSLNHSK